MTQLRALFLLIIITLSFSACKKGEEDPFLSLKSRTGRLTGDWVLKSGSWTDADSSASYADGLLSISDGGLDLEPVEAEFTFRFERQGPYRFGRKIIYPDNWQAPGQVSFTEQFEETGDWLFTGGAGETKQKSQLALLSNKIQSSRFIGSALDIISYEGQNRALVYNIIKLTDQEIKLEYSLTESDDLGSYSQSAQLTLIKE